jgi:hypothetical protein
LYTFHVMYGAHLGNSHDFFGVGFNASLGHYVYE